jgi:hypothetical protein
MNFRKALLQRLEQLDDIDSEHFPVVTIDEYFIGNDQQDSIAPNQWGYGRLPIAEIYARLKAIEARPDDQGVFVGLHQDWGEADHVETTDQVDFHSSAKVGQRMRTACRPRAHPAPRLRS